MVLCNTSLEDSTVLVKLEAIEPQSIVKVIEQAAACKTGLLKLLHCPSNTWECLPQKFKEEGLLCSKMTEKCLADLPKLVD